MEVIRKAAQFSLCMVGMHVPPEQRFPNGPVVANCSCCGKTCYFFGLSAYGLGGPPVLVPTTIKSLPQNPKV